jgi:hypothetical protein
MPALPWTRFASPAADQRCLVMATRLPLRRYRSIPGFLRRTNAIRHQLSRTEGLIGYGLDAKPLRKQFMTVSAWIDNEHLMRFVAAEPHRSTMRAVKPLMGGTRFITWTATAADLPPTWSDVVRRLAEAPAGGGGTTAT